MNFKIDPEFKKYWEPLDAETAKLLEESIIKEGLRQNLVVWKEENILLDGHQRLQVLKRHKIPFEDKVDYLSFSDRLVAKRWTHLNQQNRRGKVSLFLRISHVLEFEKIYIKEAEKRMLAGKRIDPGGDSSLGSGKARIFMAKEAPAGEDSVKHVLYIRKNDKKRFEALKERAEAGEDIPVDPEYFKVRALMDSKKKGFELNKKAVDSLDSRRSVEAFKRAVETVKPDKETQQKVAKEIVEAEKDVKGEIKERTEIFKNKLLVEKHGIIPKKKKDKEKTEEFEKFLKSCKEHVDSVHLDLKTILEYKDVFDSEYYQGTLERYEFILAFKNLLEEIQIFLGGFNESKFGKPKELGS